MWVDHMAFFFGSIFGLMIGWVFGDAAGFSYWISLPVGWFVGVFSLMYLSLWFEEWRLKRKLKNLPPLEQMLADINKRPRKLTEWEQEFIADINDKCGHSADFLGSRATMKQINIIGQVYVERIRGANLKGRQYTLESVDSETGEVRSISIGSNKKR